MAINPDITVTPGVDVGGGSTTGSRLRINGEHPRPYYMHRSKKGQNVSLVGEKMVIVNSYDDKHVDLLSHSSYTTSYIYMDNYSNRQQFLIEPPDDKPTSQIICYFGEIEYPGYTAATISNFNNYYLKPSGKSAPKVSQLGQTLLQFRYNLENRYDYPSDYPWIYFVSSNNTVVYILRVENVRRVGDDDVITVDITLADSNNTTLIKLEGVTAAVYYGYFECIFSILFQHNYSDGQTDIIIQNSNKAVSTTVSNSRSNLDISFILMSPGTIGDENVFCEIEASYSYLPLGYSFR